MATVTREPPKLVRVRRLDTIRLDSNDKTYFTKEGYLVDHPILTSVGIFEYKNPDGSIRRELRLPEYVFDEKSLETYKGKPIIITHEAGVVDKNNVDAEQIGTILSPGYQDGDNVRAEIIIHNTDAMKASGLKELSLGYNLDLIEEPGEWNGEHYDAIQTNIVVNHLALVSTARAGDQARLNIDGSDEPTLKGGKAMKKNTVCRRNDGGMMSPEDLAKSIEAYKARKAQRKAQMVEDEDPEDTVVEDGDDEAEELPATPEAEVTEVEDGDDTEDTGKSPAEIVEAVKANRANRDGEDDPEDMDTAMGVISRQDEDIDMLLACIEKLLADHLDGDDEDEQAPENIDGCAKDCGKTDSAEDKSQSMNQDGMSVDEIVRQRLHICRVGDKLRLDGLEKKSISDGKKAIISKVHPEIRLDGQSPAYINAMFDIVVGDINKRKDVAYQKKQMMGSGPARRADSAETRSEAEAARNRMIERDNEGGNR